MLGLDTLDVGIGMALMFLFVSLICSAIREFGESLLKTRASSLERGIMEMLGNSADPDAAKTLTEKVYDHPMIAALFQHSYASARTSGWLSHIPGFGRNSLPSYVPAESFAKAVLQIGREVKAGQLVATDAAGILYELRTYAGTNSKTALGRALKTALDSPRRDAKGAPSTPEAELAKVQSAIEQWFNSTMDRVAGWYTRRTAVWLFFLGLGCATVMNIDAITVMKSLSTDKTLREQVVKQAGSLIATCEQDEKKCPPSALASSSDITSPPAHAAASDAPPPSLEHIKQAAQQMNEVAWPIGWDGSGLPAPQTRVHAMSDRTFKADAPTLSAPPTTITGWLWLIFVWPFKLVVWLIAKEPLILVGWFITAFGVTFGASFWFDTLNKFMVVRSTVKPDEKSPNEPSKS